MLLSTFAQLLISIMSLLTMLQP